MDEIILAAYRPSIRSFWRIIAAPTQIAWSALTPPRCMLVIATRP